jgi:hypothetical protein
MREKIKKCLGENYSVSREITKVYDGELLVAIHSSVELRLRSDDPDGEGRTVHTDGKDMPVIAKLILSLLGALCFHILNKVNKK